MADTETLSTDAVQAFVGQNYEQCMATLQKLLNERKSDFRLRHAQAVCDFFKSGLVETEGLRGALRSEADKDAVSPTPPLVLPTPSSGSLLCLEHDGQDVALYNEAVLLLHGRRHSDAISLLTPLFRARDRLSKLLGVRVALILLACLLGTSQPNHNQPLVAEVTEFLDGLKDYMQQIDAVQKGGERKEIGAGVALCGTPLLVQYKLLQARTLLKDGRVSSTLQHLHEVYSQATEGGADGHSEHSATAFLPSLYYNNLGVAHLQLNKPNVSSIYFQKALDSFEKAKGDGADAPTPTSNAGNLGLGTGLGQSRLGSSLCHVLYNSGICLLQRGEYELAFRSFVVATPLLHNVPSLWLRLAQCCIRKHEETVKKEVEERQRNKGGEDCLEGVTKSKTPTGGTVYQLPTRGTTAATNFTQPDPAKDRMTLTFADKCLRNAHYLLFRYGQRLLARRKAKATDGKAEDGTVDEAGRGFKTQEIIDILSEDPVQDPLLQSVYAHMAYVALATNNPSVALHEARQLLDMKNCSRDNMLVCLSYMAEALCWLGKPADALEMLHKVSFEQLTTPESSEETLARASALFVNLSIVHIMHGAPKRAKKVVDEFLSKNQGQACQLLQVYLNLVTANKAEAQKLLHKQTADR